MTRFQKVSLLLLRLGTGWFMFYAGITKVFDPQWSAAGYLEGAKTFHGFYQLFLSPSVLPVTNFLNEWGLTLLGLSLIFGFFVRLSTVLGIVLMLLYYFPVLEFPHVPPYGYLVDEHVIYSLTLLILGAFQAGRDFGLDAKLSKKFANYPTWLG